MSTDRETLPILIVGGGIGGLGAALALARKGVRSHVIEQAPGFEEIGAGIQLGPNVFRMFEVLGITGEMNKLAVFPQGLEFRDSMTGETFVELPVDHRFHEKYHAPYAVIHRADMLNVIHEACKKSNLIRLTTSKKVVGIDQTAAVSRREPRAETYSGAALIGCDGLWSTVRSIIVGDGKPVVSGHIAYRAVVPTAEWPTEYRINRMILWAGRKDAPRALPAASRRIVQSRRRVPLRPLRGRLGHLRRPGRTARAVRGQVRAGAHAAQEGQCLEDVGAVRPPADQGMVQGPRHAARRRCSSDAAVPRAGRQHGAGGCGVPRRAGRRRTATTMPPRSRPIRPCAICAPRAYSSWHGCSARSITPPA